jgi:tRNA threonylcarbamoyl adenosine modification protein YeaZ
MGPGPFTGLRVGIAFARTFALSSGIPVIGVCSLDAIDTGMSDYTVAIDARRKEIYWARYEGGVRIEGPMVSKPDEVKDFIIDLYPNASSLVRLAQVQNESEPFYLRRPDAVPTAERA